MHFLPVAACSVGMPQNRQPVVTSCDLCVNNFCCCWIQQIRVERVDLESPVVVAMIVGNDLRKWSRSYFGLGPSRRRRHLLRFRCRTRSRPGGGRRGRRAAWPRWRWWRRRRLVWLCAHRRSCTRVRWCGARFLATIAWSSILRYSDQCSPGWVHSRFVFKPVESLDSMYVPRVCEEFPAIFSVGR